MIGAPARRRPERLSLMVAEYEERAAGLRERMAERYPDATFAAVGAYEANTVLVTGTHQHPARILMNDLGLKPSEVTPDSTEDLPNLSLERLDLLEDADLLFVRVEPEQEGEGRDRSILDQIQDSPLWKRLPAVRKGRVIEYDAELYYPSPLTANAFLDVIEEALFGRGS